MPSSAPVKDVEDMRNLLGLSDEVFYAGERAAGLIAMLQGVWVYDRPADIGGIRQFHHHLQHGLLARRIESSPLPFGRHRWVSASRQPPLDVVATPRRRAEFGDWLDAHAAQALDRRNGPEWSLAFLPFTDGGAGLSLAVPHCLIDGMGLCQAVADAACGHDRPVDWPAAGSRPRWRALREDVDQTIRDIPAISRGVTAAARLALRTRTHPASPVRPALSPRPPDAGADATITLPTATVFVDAGEWDDRAGSLGGTSNALLAGLAARLAHHMGRVTTEGAVTVTVPVSERIDGDKRANAIRDVVVTVDPIAAMADLSEIRAATKRALSRPRDLPDDRMALLPLVPLMPHWLIRRTIGLAAGSPTRVESSNLGAMDPAVYRPDGAEADLFAIRNLAVGASKTIMHRTGGVFSVFSGRASRHVFVSVLAYQPGRPNSSEELRRRLASALDDYALAANAAWQ